MGHVIARLSSAVFVAAASICWVWVFANVLGHTPGDGGEAVLFVCAAIILGSLTEALIDRVMPFVIFAAVLALIAAAGLAGRIAGHAYALGKRIA